MKINLWAWLRKTLADERGQIPGPAPDEPAPAEPAPDEPAPEPVPSPGEGEGTTPATEETFFDPKALAPELQMQWKRMQGAYTRRMQQFAKTREAAALVERFNADPEFARQTIVQRAQQLGLNVAGGQAGATSTQSTAPPQLVEAVRQNLQPELQWMAPALAATQWAGMQLALQPLQQQQAETVRSTRDQQFDQLAEQLSERSPGWEQHEDDMDEMLAFFKSDRMTDRRFGSKLELLYRLVTGSGAATAEAARRMAQAGKNRVVTGQPTATPVPNVSELVRKPKNMQDAWDAAAKYAVAQMEKAGMKVS